MFMGTVALEFQAIGGNVLSSHRGLCAEDFVVDNLAPPNVKVPFSWANMSDAKGSCPRECSSKAGETFNTCPVKCICLSDLWLLLPCSWSYEALPRTL